MSKKPTRRQIQEQAIHAITETARLFPNQDPIRLASGFLDFKLPPDQTLEILRQLAPYFQGENGDLIRLAAGYNDIMKSLGRRCKNPWRKALRKMWWL